MRNLQFAGVVQMGLLSLGILGAGARPASAQTQASAGQQKKRPPSAAPTAMAPALPNSSGSPRGSTHLDPQAWVNKLPHPNVVLDTNTSSDPLDTAARQTAALNTLSDFLEFQAQHDPSKPREADMPAPFIERLKEYDAALAALNPARDDQVAAFLESQAFRRGVFSFYVPSDWIAAYEAGRDARSQQRAAAQGQRAQAQPGQAGDRARQLAKDKADAGKSHVDLSVFGVRLGEPLKLPRCSNDQDLGTLVGGLSGVGVGKQVTCVGDQAANMSLGIVQFAQMAVGGSTGASSQQTVPVSLGKSRCPTWVQMGGTCSMLAIVEDGNVVAVSFTTGIDGASLQQAKASLHTKYPGAPQAGDGVECRNRLTGIVVGTATEMHWSLPGLYVSYSPLAGDCQRGAVRVQTMHYHQANQAADAQAAAAQPQM